MNVGKTSIGRLRFTVGVTSVIAAKIGELRGSAKKKIIVAAKCTFAELQTQTCTVCKCVRQFCIGRMKFIATKSACRVRRTLQNW